MYGNHSKKTTYDFAGLVLDYDDETGIATIQQRNYFKPGDQIEFFGPEIENFKQTVGVIVNEDETEVDAARHPLEIVKIKVDQKVYPYNMMRKKLV
jgi:putative protease